MQILETDFARASSAAGREWASVADAPTERLDFDGLTVVLVLAFAFDSVDLKVGVERPGVEGAGYHNGRQKCE